MHGGGAKYFAAESKLADLTVRRWLREGMLIGRKSEAPGTSMNTPGWPTETSSCCVYWVRAMSKHLGVEIPVDAKGIASPFGMLRFAEEYRRAAEIIHKDKPDQLMAPAHMLMGQSMELALKSYLMARGMQLDDLKRRPYGHDLTALLEKAMALNIQRLVELHSFNINAIQMLAPTYGNHEFRYIVTGTKSIPQWGFLSITARALTHGLHDTLLRRRVGKAAAQKRIAAKGKF